MKLVVCLVMALLFVSCHSDESLFDFVEQKTFSMFGFTLISAPQRISLKEVHLDNGILLGHEVVVEGTISELNTYNTYLVISDNTARLLVVLTGIIKFQPFGELKQKVRIWGTLESGKKGLPYVYARSIKKISSI